MPSHHATTQATPNARERVLEAAYSVAAREGVAALTLEAVAAEAGVSKGGLLYHFHSKEQLVSAMVERLCQSLEEASARAVAADPDPAGRSARAYLAACAGDLGPSTRWLALVGALTLYPRLLDPWRAAVLAGRQTDQAEGVDAAAATIVRLAADGLWLGGLLGLPGPGPQLKRKVVDRLGELTRRQE